MNTPTNTKGVIAAAAEKKAPTKQQTPAQALNSLLNNAQVQRQISEATRGNPGAFTASLLNAFNNDGKLQLCSPKLILIEALKAAVLDLPIEKSLGFAYVVPYKKDGSYYPQFQIGYKGLIQLCMRTRAYKYINADVVYEGEFQGADKLTGHIDLNGERISDKVIGYFAYIETVDGFKKGIYWDKERVRAHANRYSKSKDKDTKKLTGPWVTNFDEMAIKTVLRNLLSKYGPMSVVNAIESESVPAEVTENVGGAEIEVEAAESDSPEVPAADEPVQTPQSPEVPTDNDNEYPFD